MSGANVIISNTEYNNIESVNLPLADREGYAKYVYDSIIGSPIQYVNSVNSASGNVYLETGMLVSRPSEYELVFKFMPLNVTTTQIIRGSNGKVSNTIGDQIVILSNKLRIDVVSQSTNANISANTVCEYKEVNGTIYFNDTIVGTVNSGLRDLATATNDCIFGKINDISSTIKVYEYAYSENGVELVHLYPALDENENPCMYDAVGERFVYATGTLTYDE